MKNQLNIVYVENQKMTKWLNAKTRTASINGFISLVLELLILKIFLLIGTVLNVAKQMSNIIPIFILGSV